MRRLILTAAMTFLAVLLLAPPARAGWVWPLRGEVITPYRNGDDPYASGQHRGIDIAGNVGAPVVAAAGGEVRFSGTAGSSGLTVSIRTADGRYDTSYLHLAATAVREGDRIAAGERLGTVGTTGVRSASAPHVHFGVRDAGSRHAYHDPLDFLPPAPAAPAPRGGPVPQPTPVPTAPAPAPSPVHAPADRRVPAPAPGRVPATAPRRLPAGAPRRVPATAPRRVPAAGPRRVPAGAPRRVPRTAPHGAPRTAPHGAPRSTPHGAPRSAPHGAPGTAPRGAPRTDPHGAARAAPLGVPGAAPHRVQAPGQAAPHGHPPAPARHSIDASSLRHAADGSTNRTQLDPPAQSPATTARARADTKSGAAPDLGLVLACLGVLAAALLLGLTQDGQKASRRTSQGITRVLRPLLGRR